MIGETSGAVDSAWAELYRSVLRLRPVLEQPIGAVSAVEGLRAHADFCRCLRVYLLSTGQADEGSLEKQEIEAAVEGENWHAVWSAADGSPRPPSWSSAH